MALDCLISIGGKVAELLVEPIGRRLMYIARPNRNIPKLKSQVEELEALRKGLQDSIDAERRNGQVIRADVTLWTGRVDELIIEVKMLLQCGSNANSTSFSKFIPNPAARYKRGRGAEEKTKDVGDLLSKGATFNSTNISSPPHHPGIEDMPSGSAVMTYKATTSAGKKVMEALRDDKINFIGIHGIAGVGKTTLVKDIGKKVKEDKLFDEVLMAVVSQNQDIRKIQGEVAGWLDLKLTDETTTLRATKLCARIKGVRRILVILDDVWDMLDLQAVGIPFDKDHPGCKIIITTRREQVCRTMGMVTKRKIIALNVLSEEDSWHLFREKAGSVVDSPKLNAVAKEVWKECGHLPLALITVGSAMSGKEDPNEWKDAAEQLKNPAIEGNIDGVEENVYRSIKLSFDFLKDDGARNLLLLCSLFPEDHNIRIEDLVRYAWGLRMFKGVFGMVQVARRRVKSVINNLKEASLLLPSDKGERWIKMHDVVHDVAIRIGSGEYIVRTAAGGGFSLENWPNTGQTMGQYKGISIMGDEVGRQYPDAWDFPNLKILLLVGKQIGSSLCSHYLSNMKELNALHLSRTYREYLYYSDPRMVLRAEHYDFSHLQTCLRTLILRGIVGPDMAAIGKITALEILDLRGCCFREAPNACIRALTNLRVLDLRCAYRGLTVKDRADDDDGMLLLSPDLTRLEELYVDNDKILSWDDFNTLNKLPRLKILCAWSPSIETMPRDFVYPSTPESFFIGLGMGGFSEPWEVVDIPTLELDGIEEPACVWRGSLTTLLTKCVVLRMDKCRKVVSVWPDLTAGADDLKLLTRLQVFDCEEIRYIINTTDQGVKPPLPHRQLLLSRLEYLFLWELPRLEYLFKLTSSTTTTTPHPHHHHGVSLSNLKYVSVRHCRSLKYLFQPAIAQTLVQLEQLRVENCSQLEEIVADDNQGKEEQLADDEKKKKKNIVVVFQNLKQVTLRYLPNFRGFSCGRGDLYFDWLSLEQLEVRECPKMSTFTATTSTGATSGTQTTPKLKSVNIDGHLETIPQGMMDLNQFLQNHHNDGAQEETERRL